MALTAMFGWTANKQADTTNFGPRAQQYLQGMQNNPQQQMSPQEFLSRNPDDQRSALRASHPQDTVSLSGEE